MELLHKYVDWDIKREIGSGSYGVVYEIERNTTKGKESAALKIISIPKEASEAQTLRAGGQTNEQITAYYSACKEQAVQEYSIMDLLRSCENVVRCDDIQTKQQETGVGWDIYIRMELLQPMTNCLGRLASEDEVLRFGEEMANALVECRKHRIVHRDIKPQNILMAEDGTYKLGDFGVAKVADTIRGERLGTYSYMAPEVYHGKEYGAAADRYSLGMVLYWLLNEQRGPFEPLPPETISAEQKEKAKMLRLSGAVLSGPKNGSKNLKELVLRLCDYEAKNRLNNAQDLQEAFAAIRRQDDEAFNRILGKPAEEDKEAGFERMAVPAIPPFAAPPLGGPKPNSPAGKYSNPNAPKVDAPNGGAEKYQQPNGPKVEQGETGDPGKYRDPNGPKVEPPSGDLSGKYYNPNGPKIEQTTPETPQPTENPTINVEPESDTPPQPDVPTPNPDNKPPQQTDPKPEVDPKPGPKPDDHEHTNIIHEFFVLPNTIRRTIILILVGIIFVSLVVGVATLSRRTTYTVVVTSPASGQGGADAFADNAGAAAGAPAASAHRSSFLSRAARTIWRFIRLVFHFVTRVVLLIVVLTIIVIVVVQILIKRGKLPEFAVYWTRWTVLLREKLTAILQRSSSQKQIGPSNGRQQPPAEREQK